MSKYLLDVVGTIIISELLICGVKIYGKIKYNQGFEAAMKGAAS